ncbi:probable RNA-binding protein 46 [Schistocerca serialis cubense]|uniref:probable RNA-binding protein 46 n=1 Tax=Schistocerca serialis cubense TaxID=2023355 RepID=UPI00214EDCA9|nr:probable RNA-binding protein 46 [Schistocerca serialis cubense]
MWQPQQQQQRDDREGDEDLHERLLQLMATSGYPIVQVTHALRRVALKSKLRAENGQRRYGPPPGWRGPAPGTECEVFVGRLPRSCYEDVLVPLLSAAGRLYQLRLMMDFSGRNRGYAFAMYTSPEEAERAARLLHGREVRPGRRVAVLPAADNSRLLVTSQPAPGTTSVPQLSCDLLAEDLQRMTDGVVGVEPRGASLVVQYDSHRSAALARRRLAACVGLRVDWLPAGPAAAAAAAGHRHDASPPGDAQQEVPDGGRRTLRAVTGAGAGGRLRH